LPKYVIHGKFSEAAYLSDIAAQVNKLYSSTRRLALAASHPSLPVKHHDYVVDVLYER
jgi:hypothetical protein